MTSQLCNVRKGLNKISGEIPQEILGASRLNYIDVGKNLRNETLINLDFVFS